MSGRRSQAIITALILTAAVSIPSASQNIDYGSEKSSSPVVSSESVQDIDVKASSDAPTTAEIEEHDTLYQLSETPHKRIEKVSTPRAVLKVKITNNSRIYEIETPEGRLVEGIKEGRDIYEFKGSNRTVLESRMQDMKDEVGDYRNEIRSEMTPDLDVKVTKSKANDDDERAVIENEENGKVELDGWKLVNSDSDTFEFNDFTLESGQRVYVYDAAESDLNVSELSEPIYIYGTGIDWNYYTDEASLFNEDGVMIDEDSY